MTVKKGKARATGFDPKSVTWQGFDDFGGDNEKGPNYGLVINGIEVLDFWANGLISAPQGSPALKGGNMRWKAGGR